MFFFFLNLFNAFTREPTALVNSDAHQLMKCSGVGVLEFKHKTFTGKKSFSGKMMMHPQNPQRTLRPVLPKHG